MLMLEGKTCSLRRAFTTSFSDSTPSRTRRSTGSRGRRVNLAANPASLSLVLLRCSHQTKKRRRRFCSCGLFLGRHLEQDQLGDIGPRCQLPAQRVSGRFPVQEPLIRAEIEERELWGPEDRFGHARVADGFDVSAIIVQLNA